jgi:hypothetical protein
MNDFVEELVNHRKFMDLPEDEVDEKLKAMKKEQPRSIPYALCWMEMHPGYASLRYVSTVTPRNHSIGISPNGFLWRENSYSNLDQLLNAFKKNPQGVSKPTTTSSATVQRAAVDKPVPTSRWGPSRPPAPRTQPPPAAPSTSMPFQTMTTGWDASMPTWGQSQVLPTNHSSQNLPPPPSFIAPPSVPRPPPPAAVPPPLPRPPPPDVGSYSRQQQLPPSLPPLPPTAQAQFATGSSVQSQGRGRGRTLPAWMSSQTGT